MSARIGDTVRVEVLQDNYDRARCGMELLSPAADLVMKGRIAKQRREWAAATPAPRKARAAPIPHSSVDAVVDALVRDPAVAETMARVRREVADVKLSDIKGLPPATVAVLEAGGYKTLNDIIDLEREDFLKLAGIAPEEADRWMAFINEVTAEGGGKENEATDVAAESAARAERAAIVAEARAIADGPPVANPAVRDAAEIRGFVASELALLARTVMPGDGARHVFGLDYDDPDYDALEARREVARMREIGITIQNDAALARVTAKREAHAADRTQILALGAQFPEQRSLLARLAADVECTYAVALDRVRAAERRALVVASACAIDSVDARMAAFDLAHAKDVGRQARARVDAAAASGERLSAAEAVAQIEAQ